MFVFRVFFFGLFVLFRSDFGFAVPIYKALGGSVDLDPGHTSGPITGVTWKHKTDLALEWFGNEIIYYRTFNGRCNLNKTTGSFSITNLTLEDSGEYTPEMNDVVGATKELKVIKPVPKPTVSVDCNSEKTNCNLICEANINADFGPVTYEWKSGDTELSRNKELSITAKNEESSFYCMLENPVSSSISDEISDPISRGNNAAVIISVVVVILGLVIGVFLLLFFRNRAGHLPRFDKLFPCNEKERTRKRGAVQLAECNSTTLQIGQNPVDAVNAAPGEAEKLLTIENETNQNHVVLTPNGGFHPVSQENDQDNVKAEEELSRLLPDPQTTAEIKSKGKAALNGPANVNDDGMNNFHQTVVSIDQQQQDPLAEQVCDDEGESGQKPESEETEPTAEGPEKPNDPTCDPLVDSQPEQGSSQESNVDPSVVSPEPSSQTGMNNFHQTVGESGQKAKSEETEPTAEGPEDNSMGEEALNGANVNNDGMNDIDQTADQQQQEPPAEQVCDDEGKSGQKPESEETEPTAEGPDTLQTETSPPKPTREEMHDTDSAES